MVPTQLKFGQNGLKYAVTCFEYIKQQQNDDFRGRFMKDLTLSDSNPDFGFYGVEIFTRFEAGFE